MYHIALALEGRMVLVVGGGPVAERRVTGLLAADARVTVIAPSATAGLSDLATAGRLTLHLRAFEPNDLDGMALAMAATNDESVNALVLMESRARGILCNDASAGERGDFTVPALHRVGPVTFSVETGTGSPSYAKRLRDELAAHFGVEYGRAATTLGTMRDLVVASVPQDRRAAVMARLAGFPIAKLAGMHLGDAENAVEDETQADLSDRGRLSTFIASTKVCATRRSPLAITQTRHVISGLARNGVASTLLEIVTGGDTFTDKPITAIGSGAFVSELEQALLRKDADYAVHSCKDLPSVIAGGLVIAAISERADPHDVFCSEKYPDFDALPAGARVGTSSPRRRAQLAAMRPDLRYDEIRGNVDTRLAKLASGDYDAIVLAAAGLARLNARARHMERFPVDVMVPAVGQGALAIESRDDDREWIARLRGAINHSRTEIAVIAERACLGRLGGGCRAPIGVYGEFDDDCATLSLVGIVASPDGDMIVRASDELDTRTLSLGSSDGRLADAARALGVRLADKLAAAGGTEILAAISPLRGKRFLLGRTREQPSRIAAALLAVGGDVTELRADDSRVLDATAFDAILFPSSGSVAVVARHIDPAQLHDSVIAAMGPESAATAVAAGFTPHVVCHDPEIAAFVHVVTRAVLEQE